jgi:hypothetical protein
MGSIDKVTKDADGSMLDEAAEILVKPIGTIESTIELWNDSCDLAAASLTY